MENLILISKSEYGLRSGQLQELIVQAGFDGVLISDYSNLFALCGRVFTGYVWMPAKGEAIWFVHRPVDLAGENVIYIRKPEEIAQYIVAASGSLPVSVGLECDTTSYSLTVRLEKVFSGATCGNASGVLKLWRSVKTPEQVSLLRASGVKHAEIYRRIPGLYHAGMTDIELQIEVERLSRLEGNLGIFRISGNSMELFMANIISGKNADVPTPYDFAMGGAGLDPALPVGANGEEIRENTTVMVDFNGNFTGYMTDMTRVYSLGTISQLALDAHQCSVDICHEFQHRAVPGVEAKELYAIAEETVKSRGLERYFMGHRQHAGFVGHGIGIEVNELPVIAPRSRNVLLEGNVIALEPKFVIPEVGAVGIENTYVVTPTGAECLTNCNEQIMPLE